MAFPWWADDGPLIVVLGTSLPLSTQSKLDPLWQNFLDPRMEHKQMSWQSGKWQKSWLARDQARGRLGRNGHPGGQNFALNGTQGEVGVSLKKKNFFFFFFFFFFLGRLIFILSPHKCKLWWHYQTIYYHCIVFLLPFYGKSICNGWFASKLTENVVVLRYNFSLSDCHFSLIVLQGEVTSP